LAEGCDNRRGRKEENAKSANIKQHIYSLRTLRNLIILCG